MDIRGDQERRINQSWEGVYCPVRIIFLRQHSHQPKQRLEASPSRTEGVMMLGAKRAVLVSLRKRQPAFIYLCRPGSDVEPGFFLSAVYVTDTRPFQKADLHTCLTLTTTVTARPFAVMT